MPLTTAGTAVHLTPTVIATFCKHYQNKVHKLKNGGDEELTDDILFDQAFHIVKAFVELGTHNTVDDLQAFTNTHVPAPFWNTVIPTRIPLSSCNDAADILITLLRQTSTPSGSDYSKEEADAEFRRVVGGEKWWQVRGLDGLEAEWIAMNNDWEQISKAEKRKEKKKQRHREHAAKRNARHGKHPMEDTLTNEEYTEDIDNLTRVMLYLHGGAYFWGSINTHRYQIARFARKFSGRAFAVNYRKAPQYPWPCPLQDCLAAYLYLIRPPPCALHSAINPKHIVIAGDSAGGALALTLLTVIRDMDLPMPSGAVLISPWVDMTHSFDSVMTNAETDIIPPHGFIHKPSASWPVPAQPPSGGGRAPPSEEDDNTGTMPVPTDTGETSGSRRHHVDENSEWVQRKRRELEVRSDSGEQSAEGGEGHVSHDNTQPQVDGYSRSGSRLSTVRGTTTPPDERRPQPPPPQLIKVPLKPGEPPVELRSQIQLYATNERLTHPLVSPALHGSLGGLCPLYIIAGDGEVLRDEIIYAAHRAAHPTSYPLRDELLARGQQREVAEKWTQGTPVHLQVHDGMCHVLTVFTFTDQAKLVYRQVASFMKHLTTSVSRKHSTIHQAFPASREQTEDTLNHDTEHSKQLSGSTILPDREPHPDDTKLVASQITESPRVSKALNLPKENEPLNVDHSGSGSTDTSQTQSAEPLLRAERVSIRGIVRPLSSSALKIPEDGVGVVKAAPVKRWLTGQDAWDDKYKRVARGVEKERAGWEKKALEVMKRAGLSEEEVQAVWKEKTSGARRGSSEVGGESGGGEGGTSCAVMKAIAKLNDGETEEERAERMRMGRRWGPLDVVGEMPPPSAIAGRLDTPHAVDLLKTSLGQMRRTADHRGKQSKTKQAMDKVLRGSTEPVGPKRQSAAEQQVPANPLHGVRMWGGMMAYFVDKSASGKQLAKDALSSVPSTGVENAEEDPASKNGRLPLEP
ncbi:alpha/beta-hydrolase [Ceratobasidium sp. AG-I]|nr:alpha/beta-hydrolase [Ceratobasidium sp. AG-I]